MRKLKSNKNNFNSGTSLEEALKKINVNSEIIDGLKNIDFEKSEENILNLKKYIGKFCITSFQKELSNSDIEIIANYLIDYAQRTEQKKFKEVFGWVLKQKVLEFINKLN